MRSKISQARALFRILSTQSASGSSTAAATASSSATASASAIATATRSNTAFKRRRNASTSTSTSTSTEERTGSKTENNHRTIYIRASSPPSSSAQSVISGLQPVHPPLASLSSLAIQSFFASGRPLLEHQVIQPPSQTSSSSQNMMAMQENNVHLLNKVKSTIDNARDAIMEAASQASLLSPEELLRTTFVVTGMSESSQESAWPKQVARMDYTRFIKLVDRLAQSETGIYAVQAEAKALEAEEAQKEDVENAIADSLERGGNARVAKILGSEADLVILGEPNGPNPEWPRGVASFLVEKTRALEPPKASLEKGEENLVEPMERLDLEDLAKHFTGKGNAFTVQNVSEENANLLLSHAMVQAILPSKLKWDTVVAKMEEATGVNHSASSQLVDWSMVNADWTPTEKDGHDVLMDSVKRKRRKKMRKHKYRKFRKATRIERNRLKK